MIVASPPTALTTLHFLKRDIPSTCCAIPADCRRFTVQIPKPRSVSDHTRRNSAADEPDIRVLSMYVYSLCIANFTKSRVDEVGSYDPTLAAFTPTKYLGSRNGTCVTNYDQLGWIEGASSNRFNVYNTSVRFTNLVWTGAYESIYTPGSSARSFSDWPHCGSCERYVPAPNG